MYNHKSVHFHTPCPGLFLLTILLIVAIPISAQISVTDHIIRAGEHCPYNTRFAGTAGAGVAVTDGISGALLNPSTFHSYNIQNNATISAMAGFNSGEQVFDHHNITGGAGACISEALSCGVLYRYLKPDVKKNLSSQVTLNVSGRLFEKSLEHGMVNLGINARYEKLHWQTGPFDTLYIMRHDRVSLKDSVIGSSFLQDGSQTRRKLSLDVGFYQDNIGEGLDFGMTIHNAIGYIWTQETPTIVKNRHIDSTGTPPADIDSAYYTSSSSKYDGWQAGYNRGITVGIAFHKEILQDKALIYLPIDLELLNLFDLDMDNHYSFRTGIEVWISGKYCLRFGYGRVPEIYPENPGDAKNINDFSGGAGFRLSSIGVDIYIRKSAFGLGGSFSF